ncbi:MAG: hypothetical protein N2Z76_07855, partial [Treponemataceae bacterium]|nr:hypothetical protein [Treponemataceae bacterium]
DVYKRQALSLAGYSSCSQEKKTKQPEQNNAQAIAEETTPFQSKGPRSIVVPQLPVQSLPKDVPDRGQKNLSASLVIPSGNEKPCYPIDFMIGPLERGGLSDKEYEFAIAIVQHGMQKDRAWFISQGLSQEESQKVHDLFSMEQFAYRIGGGEPQKGGGYSFLFRLIGEENFYTGTVYVDQEGDHFLIEEIKIEKDPPLSFDPLSYTPLVFN